MNEKNEEKEKWIIASKEKKLYKKWLHKKPIKISWQKNFKLSQFVSLPFNL